MFPMTTTIYKTNEFLPERESEYENILAYEVNKKRWVTVGLDQFLQMPMCFSFWMREPKPPEIYEEDYILDWRRLEVGEYYWMICRADPEDKEIICITQQGVDDPETYKCVRLHDPAEWRFRENTHVFTKVKGEPPLPKGYEYFPERSVPNAPPIYLGIYGEFYMLNRGCKFPRKTEGYWRNIKETPDDRTFKVVEEKYLPWPVSVPTSVNIPAFLEALREKEKEAAHTVYRGFSFSRLTGKSLGNKEYRCDGWTWPADLAHYIERGVPPSSAFFKFIMGWKNTSLPTYGRDEDE